MSFNYYPSSYRSLEASLSTSASRSIAGPILFSLDRKKPVTTTSFLHTDQNLLRLSSLKENQKTNSKKSSTRVYTTTSCNTELSGQDTHQNTTKPGTPPITSKMQTSQSGTSTPATTPSRTSIKLEEQENGDVLVSVSQTQNQEEAPLPPPKTATPQENCGTTIGLPEMTPTSPP